MPPHFSAFEVFKDEAWIRISFTGMTKSDSNPFEIRA
jgi:hypothetical protein